MKTKLLIASALLVWGCASCEQKTDTASEIAAIKALFESNLNDYLDGNFKAMSDAWVKDSTSVKTWISDQGVENIVGWEDIAASEKKEVLERQWNPKEIKFDVSFYHFDVQEDWAWVLSNTKWEGAVNGVKFIAKQNRVTILKKVDGQWKLSLFAFYQMPE